MLKFNLRSLFFVVTTCAVACFFLPSIGSRVLDVHAWFTEGNRRYSAACVVLPISATFSFAVLGRRLSANAVGHLSSNTRLVLVPLLMLVALSSIYLLWVRYNFFETWYSPTERGWVYADQLLTWYNRLLDARRPAPPGTIKMHGEVGAVWATLDVLLLSSLSSMGFLFGMNSSSHPQRHLVE